MVQKCPLFVNVYTIKMSTKEDRWSKSQNLVNVVCERPPLGAFLSFEWGNLSPYGILSILAIYQVSCFGNGKVVSPCHWPILSFAFLATTLHVWYHYLHVFCFKRENKGVCLLLFGTPECGSRVSLGEYVPYYRLCLLRFPPKSFRDSKNLFMSFCTIFS